jgi:hypothetical protein
VSVLVNEEDYIFYSSIANWKVNKRTGQVTQINGWTKQLGAPNSKKKKLKQNDLVIEEITEEMM